MHTPRMIILKLMEQTGKRLDDPRDIYAAGEWTGGGGGGASEER